MSKVRQDIQAYRGRTVSFSFNAPGATMLAGAMTWRISKMPGGAVAIVAKTEGAGIVAADDSNCTVTLSAADMSTAGLDPGLYFYALEQSLAGVILQLASGRFVIRSSPGL